jgi:hypothetical protein
MGDPNWFYSTLSQSTAAIVGLSGAFMVQRVLMQRSEVASERFDLRANLRMFYENRIALEAGDAQQIRDRASQMVESPPLAGFDPFQTYVPEPSTGERLIHTATVQPGDVTGEMVRNLASVRDAMASYRDAFPATFDDFVGQLERDGEMGIVNRNHWLKAEPWRDETKPDPNDTYLAWLPFAQDIARERWRTLVDESRHRGAQVRGFRARLVPRSFYVLVGVLVAMLVVGVVVPLTQLTASSGASKLWLTIAFAALALTFPVYVWIELARLRNAGDFTRETF